VVASAAAQPASPFAGEDYAVAVLNLPAAWQSSTGGGVTVAVVDSGVDPSSSFLAPRLVPGHDFADGTGSTKDGLGHGTHVAGIVAQAAPDARIMPVKVLDSQGGAAVATIADGVRWAADHGADVVNLSIDQAGLVAQFKRRVPSTTPPSTPTRKVPSWWVPPATSTSTCRSISPECRS
jgi:subtilisin family serine protease